MQNFSIFIGIIGTFFGIVGTIAAIYFAYQSNKLNKELAKQTAVATLDIKISNLPPYKSDNEYSELIIKNVGQRVSGKHIKVTAVCSWADEIEYVFKFPNPEWVLNPNEENHWKLRFGHSGQLAGEKILIKVSDNTGVAWEKTERIV
jgi:hypothetical protein